VAQQRQGRRALYQAWLADNPNDSQVAEKLADLSKASIVSSQQRVREQTGAGFKALGAGNLSTAEARFFEVLRGNPRDAEALAGWAPSVWKQRRCEAQELLRKAAAGNAKWRPALDTANYWVLLRQAGSAADAGNAASASALAAQAIALPRAKPDGYVVRGNANVQTDTAAAEAEFRQGRWRRTMPVPCRAGGAVCPSGRADRLPRCSPSSRPHSRKRPAALPHCRPACSARRPNRPWPPAIRWPRRPRWRRR
jgi:hypothetical protein